MCPIVEDVAGPVDLAAHEGLGSAEHSAHHPPVAAPRDGVDTEEHATVARLDEGLDEHRDRVLRGAGTQAGVDHDTNCVDELVEPVDADDRGELSRHR